MKEQTSSCEYFKFIKQVSFHSPASVSQYDVRYSVHTCGRGLKSEYIKNDLHHRHEVNRLQNSVPKLMAWGFVCGRMDVCHTEISFHPFSLFLCLSLTHTHVCTGY
jgi:hypothetical protein